MRPKNEAVLGARHQSVQAAGREHATAAASFASAAGAAHFDARVA